MRCSNFFPPIVLLRPSHIQSGSSGWISGRTQYVTGNPRVEHLVIALSAFSIGTSDDP